MICNRDGAPTPKPKRTRTRTCAQIDLKPTDSKNELKKKVAKKVGIPFDRLKMRLGPFNEVHMFDKEASVPPPPISLFTAPLMYLTCTKCDSDSAFNK
jgi:hypothetical protein